MRCNLVLFLKGMLMGICDLVPGISGGTIAFITGIYERLINAVKGFSLELLFSVFGFGKKRFRDNVKKIDIRFLIVLITGILVSVLLGSRVIDYLIKNHYAETISFFIGLILASSFVIYDNIMEHNFGNYFYCLFGFLVGIGLLFLSPSEVAVSSWYLFFGGFVAISAMFLPGISGSFILLIMGLYEYVINLLSDVIGNWNYIFIFILGMIFGAYIISRIVSYLFMKDKNKTLYFLLGLVLGSLATPVGNVNRIISYQFSEILVLTGLFVLGALIVLIVGRYSRTSL